MSEVIFYMSWICFLAGGFFCVTGALGLVRMPDFYTRMHGASVTDTMGAGLMLFAMILQAGLTLIAAKLVIIGLLIFFTSPAATHALAKAAFARGVRPLLADDGGESSKP